MVVSKTRIEALSDAVFAIVMTLLILEIKVPGEIARGQLAHTLAADAFSWLSFAVTFFLAAVFWVDQHRVLHALATVSRPTVILTFVFLAFVTVLPFSTSLWGHYVSDQLAVLIYLLNQFGIATTLSVQLEIAIRKRHVDPGADLFPARFRLAAMSASFLVVAVAARMLEVRHLWIVALAVGVSARAARMIWIRRRRQSSPASWFGGAERAQEAGGESTTGRG